MKKVVFDSSFLMAVAEKPSDWMGEVQLLMGRFEPVMLDCVRAELAALSSGRGRRARYARVGLELSKGFRTEPCGSASVDDEVASAGRSAAAVATVDRGMAGALRASGVQVIGLRSGRVALL